MEMSIRTVLLDFLHLGAGSDMYYEKTYQEVMRSLKTLHQGFRQDLLSLLLCKPQREVKKTYKSQEAITSALRTAYKGRSVVCDVPGGTYASGRLLQLDYGTSLNLRGVPLLVYGDKRHWVTEQPGSRLVRIDH